MLILISCFAHVGSFLLWRCAHAYRLRNPRVTWNGHFPGLLSLLPGAHLILSARPTCRPDRSRCGAALMESDRDPEREVLRSLVTSPQQDPCAEILQCRALVQRSRVSFKN